MALRWIDSFDYIGDDTLLASKYDPVATGGSVWLGGPGRTGPSYVGVATGAQLVTKPLPTSGTTCIMGVAFYVPAASMTSAGPPIIAVQEGGVQHLCVGVDYNPAYGSAFKLQVLRGSTVLATTTGTYQANTWWYVEFKVTVHASAGSYELRVDTVPVLTASGINTTNGGTGIWDRVGLMGCFAESVFVWYDDYYILDGSGSTRNNFLGVQRVEAVLMKTDAAGAGAHQEWTPLSGTDHGAMVDETAVDGDTTYNTAAAPAKDTYQHNPLTLPGAINGVQVNPSWKKTDAGACTARTLARSSGTTYGGTTQSPLTTYSIMPDVLETNPTGADWTAAAFNAAEFGVERLT